MSSFKSTVGLAACAAALISVSGCVVTTEPTPIPIPSGLGLLTVLTTIEGSTAPAECVYANATDIELAVYEGPEHVTTETAPCSDFSVSVDLDPGTYNADVTLLDAYGDAATTTLTLDTLRVVDGTDLQVDVDFPTSSFIP